MAKRSVLIELTYNRQLAEAAFAALHDATASLETGGLPKLAGIEVDAEFAVTPLPGVRARSPMAAGYASGVKFDLALEPKDSTYIVRGEVEEKQIEELSGQKSVVGVFADVAIQPALICPGSPPLGTDLDVERLLCASRLHADGMDGSGALVAIVDSGVNTAYLASRGKTPIFDVTRSWVPRAGLIPGSLPVGHGTMCAYDVCIAAPRCTILDIALLQSTAGGANVMAGFLSDAVRAYAHLLDVMSAPRRPGEARSLVVNNSWGMFHPSWDFLPGHAGNYSDNPNHPFNRIVASLERAGADILFAAGNCGADCPDSRCQGVTANAIYGANGHPSVLCIGGVDTERTRVGYSTKGPGRLAVNKPDLCGYTHFRGSGVYAADGGTSAATPVVAGVVAAIRSVRPYTPDNPSVAPAAVRALLRSTAQDLGDSGFDFDHGFGVVNACAIHRRLQPVTAERLCRLFPRLCEPRPIPVWLCRHFPEVCRPRLPGPAAAMTGTAETVMGQLDPEGLVQLDSLELLEVLDAVGLLDAAGSAPPPEARESRPRRGGGCGCGDAGD